VLIPEIGAKINGSRRWIRAGIFGYQPSEFAKLAMIIFLSGYIAKNREKMATFAKGFVVPIILIGVVSLLILKEPDFGTAMFITVVSFILLMTGGTRIIYVIFTLIASIPHIYQIYINKFPAYQHDRLLAFLDPWKDPMGIGYQIIQSWIALGSGGIAGLGLGESRQKLFFLPMSDNDFIFSIIGEEFGFIGTTCIIIMFALFAWQGMRICKAAPDAFGFFLALGITASIALQAAINVAVVTGSIPTKGLPLPFISTGGSSILLSLLGVGILLNIARQSENSDVSACNVEDNRRFVT
jgi:cell division protein FtsW